MPNYMNVKYKDTDGSKRMEKHENGKNKKAGSYIKIKQNRLQTRAFSQIMGYIS